ncbi:MAG: ABC transporter substrate-binding protein [Lactobacillales bacterium]|jgi:NitT/TauT family transport system substrate-binding protein|nr:ABC transporter substrate-binding protein [Lactobacillales bacterium]
MKKKLLITVAALSLVALAGCGTSGKSAKTDDKDLVVRIADNNDVCGAPQQIAEVKGFFKEEGIKIEKVNIGKLDNLGAINADKIDASNSLIGSVIQPLANGAKIKITTGLHTGCLQILTRDDGSIKTAADLKGKKIGVPSVAGSPATFARRVLSDAGLNVDLEKGDVEFIAYDASALGEVLANGTVDAIAASDPVPDILSEQYHFATLVNSATDPKYKDEYCCVAYVSEKLAKEHPEAAKHFTIALQKAAKWVGEHPEETAKLQFEHKFVDGDLNRNEKLLASYNFIPSYQGAYDAFAIVGKDLQKIGILDKDVDVKAVQKASFVKFDGVE